MSISPSNEYSGLISFRIDWFDLLAAQGFLSLQANSLHLSHQRSPVEARDAAKHLTKHWTTAATKNISVQNVNSV